MVTVLAVEEVFEGIQAEVGARGTRIEGVVVIVIVHKVVVGGASRGVGRGAARIRAGTLDEGVRSYWRSHCGCGMALEAP